MKKYIWICLRKIFTVRMFNFFIPVKLTRYEFWLYQQAPNDDAFYLFFEKSALFCTKYLCEICQPNIFWMRPTGIEIDSIYSFFLYFRSYPKRWSCLGLKKLPISITSVPWSANVLLNVEWSSLLMDCWYELFSNSVFIFYCIAHGRSDINWPLVPIDHCMNASTHFVIWGLNRIV